MTTLTNSIAAKLLVAFVAVAMAFAFVAPAAQAQDVSDMSLEELIELVNQLQAQLGGGDSMSGSCNYTWTRSLSTGSTGQDVMNLQSFLNMSADTQVAVSGAGAPGSETSYYGSLTAAAVSKFQTKYSADILAPVGLTSPTGYFGPSTMAKANMLCANMDDDDDDDSDDDDDGELSGGAGSIEDADYVSGLSNEEVGEDEEDVEVAGLEIEADDGSDIRLTAVNLNFSKGTADRDFDKYADEVSVWFDGDEVARIDADEFEDDNNYDKTISLDSGAVIDAGETGELTVAVSGINNLDSGDEGETWTVEFESVRFQDGQNAVITDTSTGDINDGTGRTFSFENFAAAADVELKFTNGDDDINDARAIDVDDTDDTDNVDLFSFNMEAEGTSDIIIDDMPLLYVATGAASPEVDEIINSAELWIDGELIDSLSIPTSATTTSKLVFDDFDYTLEAGEEVEVVVRVDINDLQGDFAAGDTLQISIGENETDDASFDAEDEEGNDLVDADKTGSATSDAHAFFDEGINVEFVSADADAIANDNAADNDQGIFTMVFDITAFGDTVYVDETPVATDDTTPVDPGTSSSVHYVVYDSSSATTDDLAHTLTYTTPSGVSDSGDNIEIQEDKTTRVTLTVTQTNDSVEDDGIYYMEVVGISFSAADDTTYEFMYTFDLDEFETNTISLN